MVPLEFGCVTFTVVPGFGVGVGGGGVGVGFLAWLTFGKLSNAIKAIT